MTGSLRSLLSGWGRTYLGQLAAGRFRFPEPAPGGGPVHFVVVPANHFEPTWNSRSHREGLRLVQDWCREIEGLGVKDVDGHPFKHTYFFPA